MFNNGNIAIIDIGSDKIFTKIGEIAKDNIYTIGNSYNDIEMIEKFKGFSIENSVPSVRVPAIAEYDSVSSLINDIMRGQYESFK